MSEVSPSDVQATAVDEEEEEDSEAEVPEPCILP